MPPVVINELSAVGQAANVYDCDAIMRALAETLRALEPIQCGGTIHTHSSFCNQRLSVNQTVYEWLYGPFRRDLLAIRQLLCKLLRHGPFIDTRLADIAHTCERTFNGQCMDHAQSSLAGAAHLNGWLISLRQCPSFPPGPVTVSYSEGGGDVKEIDLAHFVNARDVQRVRRIYQPNPKHGTIPTDGVIGTPMDLSDEEAQRVLDSCVSAPEEKRVCGRYNGRIYVFSPHRLEENLYHGFPVDKEELRQHMPQLYKLLFSSG